MFVNLLLVVLQVYYKWWIRISVETLRATVQAYT